MSYPRVFQVLVIEDEQAAKEYYDLVIDFLREEGVDLAPPKYAFCHQDGEELLSKTTIFHLVILDLLLPLRPGEAVANGITHGFDLLKLCSERDPYPIPALLVISGHLDKANQGELDRRVRSDFAYGRVLAKGGDLKPDIREALQFVDRYCSIGIHVGDSGRTQYPTLSPREEDLLRRSVLEQEACCGLDLRWWSSEFESASWNSVAPGWTKVLMGSFLLTKGRGLSRPTFFKFSPSIGAESVVADAKLMEHKLPHIRVCGSIISKERSLLVTRKAGQTDEAPISLAGFLEMESTLVGPSLPGIVSDLARQLDKLGDASPDQGLAVEILWQHHRIQALEELWHRYRSHALATDGGLPDRWNEVFAKASIISDPLEVLKDLRSNLTPLRFERQTTLHGDLNLSNVAVDIQDDRAHGYIFDASGSGGGVNIKDLATLEVTALLHQRFDGGSLVEQCQELFMGEDPLDIDPRSGSRPAQIQNTIELVQHIRWNALQRASPGIYALMVFDAALIQFGGLSFTISHNKINSPVEAARLCSLVSRWLRQVAPELVRPSQA